MQKDPSTGDIQRNTKDMLESTTTCLVIQFKMKLGSLMAQIHSALLKLGILPNRLTSDSGVFTFRITDQGEIGKFLDTIQPRLKTSVPVARL